VNSLNTGWNAFEVYAAPPVSMDKRELMLPSFTRALSNALIAPSAVSVGVINQTYWILAI
ncbi:hypothetical protein KIW_02578, partial [Pediococcus acidilactici MA18/5M]